MASASQAERLARADAAWSEYGRRSRVSGIADGIRSARTPQPYNPERRAALLRSHLAGLKRAWEANRFVARPAPDDSRYFPHQSDREGARRRRRMGL